MAGDRLSFQSAAALLSPDRTAPAFRIARGWLDLAAGFLPGLTRAPRLDGDEELGLHGRGSFRRASFLGKHGRESSTCCGWKAK
jgi:hypothetical protein